MLPGSDWFPWEEVVEEDRGYGTVCWVWTRPLPPTGKNVRSLQLDMSATATL